MKSWDVIIAGAGIIGVSLALELRERGASVLVLDRANPGGEASSAAAGMLAPADPETPVPLRPLAFESGRMFPEFVRKVETGASMQVDFRRVGTIAILSDVPPPRDYRSLSAQDLQQMEPFLHREGQPAYFVQEDSVDPNLLMQAAMAAALSVGVEIRGQAAVNDIRPRDGDVDVVTETDHFSARSAVDCRGAWSGAPVRPRKGQMLYVQPQASVLHHVLRAPEVYVVPRSTGKILIGASVEDVGYDKSVDASTIQQLLTAAAKYLPELASSPVTQTWAGLRPGTPDDLPIIGATETPGHFVASGHFRNGILLAPVTARIVADLVERRRSPIDISTFSPARFHQTAR